MKYTLASLTLASLVLTAQGFAPLSTTSVRANVDFQTQLASTVDDKTEVREYFNTEGFNRWNKIYSESDEVNSVQLDIRNGHDQTIQKILNWISDDGDIKGKTVCDCGCGVGSLAIPLAQMGEFIFMNHASCIIPCSMDFYLTYRNLSQLRTHSIL
jgi:magnesium-protoporphyrin O-methyltransferase